MKCCLFFYFVCFNGCQIYQLAIKIVELHQTFFQTVFWHHFTMKKNLGLVRTLHTKISQTHHFLEQCVIQYQLVPSKKLSQCYYYSKMKYFHPCHYKGIYGMSSHLTLGVIQRCYQYANRGH